MADLTWKDRWQRAAPHLVAAFLVVHVTAQIVDVIPDVRLGLDRKSWQEPRVQHELSRWSARFGVEKQRFEDLLYDAAQLLHGTRTALRAPFRPYMRATAQKQSWAMFVAGSRTRDRFEVRARTCGLRDRGCEWETLYKKRDPEHTFMREPLESPRVRSANFRWGWKQGQKSYTRGCKALAARAFDARPDLEVVQCRFEQTQAPDPRKDVPTTVKLDRERTVLRKDVRR